jgi:zinc protease
VTAPDEAFRYQAPVPRPAPRVRIPAIDTFELDGGITVYLAAKDTLPTVSLSVSIPTGTIADPPGQRGLVALAMDLVEQGTVRLDKAAWAAAKADLASSVYTYANTETLGFGLASLHRTFEATADLAFELLETPGLRERDLSRLVAHRKSNLAQNKAAPASLSRRLWPAVIHGLHHPYGRPTMAAEYDAIAVPHCVAHWASQGPEGASMFVAGATDEAELRRVLQARLAAWGEDGSGRPRRSPAPAVPPSAPMRGTIFFSHVPGAAQSQILVGHAGPLRTAPDYEATRLMAQILGGGFSSRINMNIREDKGYAYGARAGFSYRKTSGTFCAGSSVQTAATAPALREIATEIRKMREAPVLEDELRREMDGTLLGLPASFSTAQRIRSTYANLVFYGLPLDWYETFQTRLSEVTTGDVLAAARAHLRERDHTVLVVGDGDVIRTDLQRLADEGIFGEAGFVELDTDGLPITHTT